MRAQVVCSGRSTSLVKDFASRLDFVGGRQRLRYWLGDDPPTLVRRGGKNEDCECEEAVAV